MKKVLVIFLSIFKIILTGLIVYSLITSLRIYKDYTNFKNDNIKICRYNNVINATGDLCYGNANINSSLMTEEYWAGNHVWNINNEKKLIDKTCLNCKTYKKINCLKIEKGIIKKYEWNSLKDIFIDFYFFHFSMLKKINIIS